MNSWYKVIVKYTKQKDDGTFVRVSETYLVAAVNHGDAEARIYDELGNFVRGEFFVTKVSKKEFQDLFHYEDSDLWFEATISYEVKDEEGNRSKKTTQLFLVTAHTAKEAYERLNESLNALMSDYFIQKIQVSSIIDVFPFKSE